MATTEQLLRIICKLINQVEETVSDSEGRYPAADYGCIDCTVGTVPNDRNTGLCGYHEAKRLTFQALVARCR